MRAISPRGSRRAEGDWCGSRAVALVRACGGAGRLQRGVGRIFVRSLLRVRMPYIAALVLLLLGSGIALAGPVPEGARPAAHPSSALSGSDVLPAPSSGRGMLSPWPGTRLAQFCPPGWGICPGGGCAPLGSSCCGGGRYCNPGFTCCGTGCCAPGAICTRFGCTPPGAIDCGSHWCQPGQRCGSGGGCIPAGAVDCGFGRYCQAGQQCGSGGGCVPAGSVDCGSGRYCPAGHVCVGSAQCISQQEYDRRQAELEAQRRAEAERQAREAQRLAEARKFAEDRDRCRQFRLVAACDAALQSPHATQRDRDDIGAWRESGVQFAANLAACRKHDVAACDAALASPVVTDQTRAILLAWRAESSPLDRALSYSKGVWNASRAWVRDRTAMIASLPLSTQIAGGIALALAVILGVVLFARRGAPRRAEAGPGAWWRGAVAAGQRPRSLPGAAGAEPRDAPPTRQPQAAATGPPWAGASETQPQSQHQPSAAPSGVRKMSIVGLNLHGTYGAARAIAGLISGLGWLLVVAGALTVFAGLAAVSQSPFGGLILIIGLAIAATGILQVAAGQMLRASADSADYARQALLLQIGIAEGRSEIDLQQQLTGPVRGAAPTVSAGGLARAH